MLPTGLLNAKAPGACEGRPGLRESVGTVVLLVSGCHKLTIYVNSSPFLGVLVHCDDFFEPVEAAPGLYVAGGDMAVLADGPYGALADEAKGFSVGEDFLGVGSHAAHDHRVTIPFAAGRVELM